MFSFFSKKKVKTPFREWVLNQTESSKKMNLQEGFSLLLFEGIAEFNSYLQDKKDDINNRLTGDSTLFEIGAFILFYIDARLFSQKSIYRQAIMKFLFSSFIDAFNKNLNSNQVDRVVQNRIKIYSQVLNEYKSEYFPIALDYLCEFVFRTVDNKRPELIELSNYFRTNTNIHEDTMIRIQLLAYLNKFLPLVRSNTDKLIKMIEES
jgi:hypothetical protein